MAAPSTCKLPKEPVETAEPLIFPSTSIPKLPEPALLNVKILFESDDAWKIPFPSSFCIVKVAVPVLLCSIILR